MHKLKHQAKQNAWYDDADDEQASNLPLKIKNPWTKPKRRSTSSRKTTMNDEEAGNAPLKPSTNGTRGGMEDIHEQPAREPFADPGPIERTSSPLQDSESTPISKEKRIEENSSETMTNGVDSDKTSLRKRDTPLDESEEKPHGFKGFLSKNKKKTKTASTKDMEYDDNGKVKPKPNFTVGNQIRNTLFSSWVNILLIMSPLGIAVHFAKIDDIAIFVINFIAIIPLAGILSYATEEIALRTGEVIGGLLNASFGNAVELIVSIIALVKNQTLIVQTSLIGSMLSNLLLVMGMCFFFGGINRLEQNFNMTVAQTAASLLFLAVSGLIIPTAFDEFARTGSNPNTADPSNPKPHVAALSRATAIMLLIVYACYLFFQLKSHNAMFAEASEKTAKRDVKGKLRSHLPERFRKPSLEAQTEEDEADDDDEPEEPQLHLYVAIGTLVASTVLVALNAEFLVDSINSITCGGGISKNFVGLILLPIVGNAAEHATAVTVAVKDKMDLAIGVAVGSSMQIALLVLPFTVVLGWILGKDDMTLFFDGFQIAILFVTVLLVNYLIQDGKSHWLEGVLLMTLYIIIAVAAWYYPTSPELSDCPTK